MSSKPQQKNGGGQPQKRKADSQPQQPQKKAKEQAPAQPQQAKKPQQQQQAPKAAAAAAKPAAQPQQKGKKAAAPVAAEPEPEEEDDEDDGEEQGERDEEALALIEKIAPAMEEISTQLEAFDEQMNAEIYAIQKKFLLKKRPILSKRDALFTTTPKMWKALFTNHETFVPQLEEVDLEILNHLVSVEVEEKYSDPSAEKQQIEAIVVSFTFSAGSKIVKAGKFKKTFAFNSEKETLECKATPLKEMPFVDAAKFSKTESFFASWFASEGEDDGILAAQDALSSELYVDPLQLYRHISEGGNLSEIMGGDSDGEDGAEMMFEESSDDEEAPQLV